MLLHRDVLSDRPLRERHPSLGDVSKDDSWISGRVNRLQVENALGQRDGRPHGVVEERLLRLEMPQYGGGGDTQLTGDICQGARVEALLRKDLTCGFKESIAIDDRWPAHL